MSTETWNAWEKRIAPRLQDLEYCGKTIARHARHIQNAAGSLPVRPAWETKAQESLATAEQELQIALAVVRAVKDQYANLPVMLEAAE